MNNFINQFKAIIGSEFVLIILILLILIIVLTAVIRNRRCKSARDKLDLLEEEYAEIKSVPLSFKLNKAKALAKLNEDVEKELDGCQEEYDKTQEDIREFSTLLAELDDLIFSKKIAKANEKFEDAEHLKGKCQEQVIELDNILDRLLEQERDLRDNINKLKEQFRNDKQELYKRRGEFYKSAGYLDNLMKDVESMFSVFEEWMYASEFNKATDKQNEIKEAINDLETYLNTLPEFYVKCRNDIPEKVEELEYLYGQCKSKKVYLAHLDVVKNIESFKDQTLNILNRLDNINLVNIESDINELENSIENLKASIEKEEKAFDYVQTTVESTYILIKKINHEINRVKGIYKKVKTRFGFETLGFTIEKIDKQIDLLNEQKNELDRLMNKGDIPFTTLAVNCEQLANNSNSCDVEVQEVVTKLEKACSDEERAEKQLLKLQLIVNDIRCKIAKNNLPSISDKYSNDIIKANTLIIETRNILQSVPLNVDELNTKLQDAIDYIYTLYNNVNNLVGMAMMVENAIVFGNKYRSDYPEVDAELTRAELCFSNGQYTKALKIALNTLEKIHPGVYDKLIKQGSGENE